MEPKVQEKQASEFHVQCGFGIECMAIILEVYAFFDSF